MGLGGIGGGQPHVNASQIGGVSQTKGAGASEKSGFMSKIKNFFSPKAREAAKQLAAPKYEFQGSVVTFTKGPKCSDKDGEQLNHLFTETSKINNKGIHSAFDNVRSDLQSVSQEKLLRGTLIDEAQKLGYICQIQFNEKKDK